MLISEKWKTISLGNKKDKITIEIKALCMADYHVAIALLLKHNVYNTGDNKKLNQELSILLSDDGLVPIIQKIIPSNTRNLQGLQCELENGDIKDTTIEQFCNSGACITMALITLVELINNSQLTVQETKN